MTYIVFLSAFNCLMIFVSFRWSYWDQGLGGESEEMDVDDRDIGRIVGRGGCNIRDLQDGTKCKIITPNKRGGDVEWPVFGF